MSMTMRITHIRLNHLGKDDIVRYPGGEFPGWWQVMSTDNVATNFLTVTLAEPLLEGGWRKRTTPALPYFELVQIQQFEKAGPGIGLGVGIAVPL